MAQQAQAATQTGYAVHRESATIPAFAPARHRLLIGNVLYMVAQTDGRRRIGNIALE